jgi:AcrR family transcriptional regulator
MSDNGGTYGETRMKKNPEATALTRNNLIEAFWSLYCQKKIEYISIKAITDKAGYHRSTFYEYFVDIYDLLNQLEESLLAYIQENVVDSLAVDRNGDIPQGLVDLYESKGKYLSVLLGEIGDPDFPQKLKTVMGSVLMKPFGLSESDLHTSYILEFGLSAIIATITHWYRNNKNLPSKELVSLIRSMLMNGIFPIIRKYSNLPSDSFR